MKPQLSPEVTGYFYEDITKYLLESVTKHKALYKEALSEMNKEYESIKSTNKT